MNYRLPGEVSLRYRGANTRESAQRIHDLEAPILSFYDGEEFDSLGKELALPMRRVPRR